MLECGCTCSKPGQGPPRVLLLLLLQAGKRRRKVYSELTQEEGMREGRQVCVTCAVLPRMYVYYCRYRAPTGSTTGSLLHFFTKLELRRRVSILASCCCSTICNFFVYSRSSLIFTVSCPHRDGEGEWKGEKAQVTYARSAWGPGGAKSNSDRLTDAATETNRSLEKTRQSPYALQARMGSRACSRTPRSAEKERSEAQRGRKGGKTDLVPVQMF